MLKHIYSALVFLFIVSSQAMGDDVEIYFGGGGGGGGTSLVMFTLDYRPNLGSTMCNGIDVTIPDTPDFTACTWTAEFPEFNDAFEPTDYADGTIVFLEYLRASLRHVLADPDLAAADMQFGLMLNHDSVNNCENSVTVGCSNGAYVAMGFRDHNEGSPTGTERLLEHLSAIPIPQGNLSHPYQGKELYFEFFRYMSGQGVYNGHVGAVDYADRCSRDNLDSVVMPSAGCNKSDDDFDSLIHWDKQIESANTYVSPWAAGSNLQCSTAHMINIMFGVTNQDADSDAAIENTKANGGLDMTLSGGRSQFNQVVGRLSDIDIADGTWGAAADLTGKQNVISHFVFNGNLQNTMNGLALSGDGKALPVSDDPRAVVKEIKNLFLAIIRQTSTFEAPAVTVNSYNRLSHMDSLFYALFGPELQQDWPGNLKKYKLGEIEVDDDSDGVTDYKVITILDAADRPAVTANGLFDVGACSFWSDCSGQADGDEVALGGAAEEHTNSRNVYTNTGNGTNESLAVVGNVVNETNASVTAAMLGVSLGDGNVPDIDADGDEDNTDVALFRTQLLRIGRGVDESDTDIALKTMGDPIHARPVVVVYDGDLANAGANPDISIITTTNEGYMHLIDADDGSENFAFIPQELLPMIRKVNKDPTASAGVYRYDIYGLDGSPVVLRQDNDGDEIIESADGDKVMVYLTQRRGGRNIYAVDITNRASPVLKWRILGGTSTGFGDLAETWSEPVIAKMKISGVVTDVLVFGGGYDSDRYDGDAGDPDDNSDTGRSVYIVNASSGALIWRIGPDSDANLQITSMLDSIPSAIKVIDFKDDYIMDRLYFIDVIGRIHKVDFDNTGNTALLGGGLVADLSNGVDQDSCDMTADSNACRRFYNALDVSVMIGQTTYPYVQLAVGSGYRVHPKNTKTQERFYAVYDDNALNRVATSDYDTTHEWTGANLVDVTGVGDGNKTLGEQTSALQALLGAANKHGWYINMDQSLGEKVISTSTTITGLLLFTTYVPEENPGGAGACSAGLGGGRLYLLNSYNGLPIAALSSDPVDILEMGDTVTKSQRFTSLPREGMPTDPSIIFKQKDDGKVVPAVVVGTQIPLDPDLLNIDLEKSTWWLEK